MAENDADGATEFARARQILPVTKVTSEEVKERLVRFEAATQSLLDRISHTQALLSDAAAVIVPAYYDANGTGPGAAGRAKQSRQGPVLSLAEVSERTGRHPDLLRRWAETGRIPAIRVGRSWAIPESALKEIAWPAARRRRAARGMRASVERPQDQQPDRPAVDVEG